MKSRASARSVPPPSVERLFMSYLELRLVRFAQFEGDRGCKQEQADQHREIQQVADVDDALPDGVEMGEERERSDRIDQRLRRPAAEHIHPRRKTGEQKKEAGKPPKKEGDPRAGRGRGQAGADGEEPAAEQQT